MTPNAAENGAFIYGLRLRGVTWNEIADTTGWNRRHCVNLYNRFRAATGAAPVDTGRGGRKPARYRRPSIVLVDDNNIIGV